jgi:hypothetical protein
MVPIAFQDDVKYLHSISLLENQNEWLDSKSK